LEDETEIRLVLADNDEAASLMGSRDQNLRAIEREFDARIIARGNELQVRGSPEQVQKVGRLLSELLQLVRRGHPLSTSEVKYAARAVRTESRDPADAVFSEVVFTTHRGKQVKARTINQRGYLHAIHECDLVFAVGPAGTGKTYLAVAAAVAALQDKRVSRIILTRPALEAGEKLGYLPGDLREKIDPYLRPLYDALLDMMEADTFQRHMERGLIEVAPLAFMRGRTLNDSFIILDEGQNTTPEQMKMFLTRLGFGSRAVVTGDVTQIDLPHGQYSGLNQVRDILRDVDGLRFVYFDDRDVVRHELVQRIIKAYEQSEEGTSGMIPPAAAGTGGEP
jgi:phosphate starvation-inducible PhoH-like protein